MPLKPTSPSDPEQIDWFANEVRPHEPALRSYLKGKFPAVRDVDDVIQESYLRILHEKASRPVQYAKAFLFKVARNMAIDLVRRKQKSPEQDIGDLAGVDVIEEGADVVEKVSMREKICVLAEAVDSLPARCREIVILRKLQLLPQREVAIRLGLSEKTVEAQLALGVKRCGQFLRKRGVHHHYSDELL